MRDRRRDLDEEIRFHIDRQVEKNVRAGMPPEEARRQALITFGGVDRTKEAARDEFPLAAMEHVLRDLRYGVRALRRAPAFAAVAIVLLAIGIGATTAMFSVVNGVLLHPLPYPDQDRLIELVHEAPGLSLDELFASPAIYFTYRDHSATFESVGLWDWDGSPVTVTGPGEAEAVPSLQVTHEILPMLGADPIRGRGFTEADDRPESPAVAIVSFGYWQRRFGGADPLGRTLIVDGTPRRIVGVLPASFRFFDYPADIFYPLQPVRSAAVFPAFDGRAIARLKPGVTLADANADVSRMIPMLTAEFGDGTTWQNARFGPRLRWLRDTVVGTLGGTLWVLMGTIGLLFLIACANVANLVLVRAQMRERELATRAALGAGWGGILRVVFAESVLLGVAGGVAGLGVAYAGLPLLLTLAAGDLPAIMQVAIDPAVLLVAAGSSIVAMALFTLVPALRFVGRDWAGALHDGGRSMTGGRHAHRARHVLLVMQVALALVLLVGAGLMIRTFQHLHRVDPGFSNPDEVLTFQVTLPPSEVSDPDRGGAFDAERALGIDQALVERFEALPGVVSTGFAGFNDGLPLDGDGRQTSLVAFTDGRVHAGGQPRFFEMQRVSPGFFETMQTTRVAGRALTWDDVHGGRRVILVSENLARREWGGASRAIGQRMGSTPSSTGFEVVGVVKDVHHNGVSQPAPEVVAFPLSPSEGNPSARTASFVVRSPRANAAGFVQALREAADSVDPNLALADIRTLGEMYRRSLARTSVTLLLLVTTGGMALAIGLIGICGIVTCMIGERRREIGIRVALGARPDRVRRMFVGRVLALVAIGAAIGLGAALGLTRLMASQLYGVDPLDPVTFAAVALVLAASAGAAGTLTARRAAALDPVEVLRGE